MIPRLPAAIACLTLLAAPPLCGQTSLTIYQDGRVLQRRVLPLRVPAGESTHRLTLGQLDPGSIFALDPGMWVTGVRFDPAVSEQDALRRAVGRMITFRPHGAWDTTLRISAKVLGANPERYLLPDGRVTFQRPGTPLYPAELAPADASVELGVQSDRARTGLGLGYFSSGASWSANYAILVGGGSARVSGSAAVTASLRVDSAEVQLLAGTVGNAGGMRDDLRSRGMEVMALRESVATEQSVGEAHVYTLPGRYTFDPGLVTVAPLFEPTTAPVQRTYTVRGLLPYYGGLPQMGDEQTQPVTVTYVIKRPAKSAFGDLPMPGGVARVYERDAGGRPQLVGEGSFAHTAPGQDLNLEAGTAFDLTATRLQATYETQRISQRTVATADYRVTVTNAKDSAVIVDVLEQRAGEWSVLSSSIPAEKVSSTLTRFRVRVPARGEAALTYRVRVVW